MHTVAPFTLWSLSVVALIINYIKRTNELDALYSMHHSYMIGTFWWTMLWLLLSGPLWAVTFVSLGLLPLGPIAFCIIGLWYIYRFVRGWLRFSAGKPPA